MDERRGSTGQTEHSIEGSKNFLGLVAAAFTIGVAREYVDQRERILKGIETVEHEASGLIDWARSRVARELDVLKQVDRRELVTSGLRKGFKSLL